MDSNLALPAIKGMFQPLFDAKACFSMSFEHKGEREGYGYSLKGTNTMTYNRFCYKRESLNSIMGKEKVYEIPSKPHILVSWTLNNSSCIQLSNYLCYRILRAFNMLMFIVIL